MYIIKVVEYIEKPYGRYRDTDGLGAGEVFRDEILAPALRKYPHVHVDLTGYNRYGRSFLDEAFGGLIRESGFSEKDVLDKLTYSHDLVKSIEDLIEDRINAAIRDTK